MLTERKDHLMSEMKKYLERRPNATDSKLKGHLVFACYVSWDEASALVRELRASVAPAPAEGLHPNYLSPNGLAVPEPWERT